MALRGRKSGDAWETEIKQARRYDKEEELGTVRAILDWINACCKDDPDFQPCKSTEWKTVSDYLKDGIIICKLLNRIRKEYNLPPVHYKKNAKKIVFAAMSNIEAFNKGAEEFGVPTTSLFQTPDLADGRKGPLLNVINCINQLGFVANASGFNPKYNAIQAPRADF